MRGLAMVISLLLGCGTGGDSGGGAAHLPVAGGGPFGPLDSLPGDLIDAPVALADSVDLDDPFVIANGAALTVWVTAHRSGGDDIERADAVSIRKGFGDLEVALSADQTWEGGGVSAPSIAGDTLFYWAEGGIGAATSSDGHNWTKLSGPLIGGVGPPAAVKLGDKFRIYYPKNGALYASEGTLDHLVELGEMVAGAPFGTGIGRAFARSAQTPAGRVRHDLYFTVVEPMQQTCGWASSYDAVQFDVFQTPILDPKTDAHGCTMAPYQTDGIDSFLALWVQERGSRDVLFAGKSP